MYFVLLNVAKTMFIHCYKITNTKLKCFKTKEGNLLYTCQKDFVAYV